MVLLKIVLLDRHLILGNGLGFHLSLELGYIGCFFCLLEGLVRKEGRLWEVRHHRHLIAVIVIVVATIVLILIFIGLYFIIVIIITVVIINY